MRERQAVEEILAQAGIVINGQNPWDIHVKNDQLYGRLLRFKSLGLGESYMDGWWECQRLDQFMCRILRAEIEEKVVGNLSLIIPLVQAMLFNRQSRTLALEVAERHYNVGNDLFMSFLDPYNQYSCAYFNGTEDLVQAQINKMDLICRKLALKKSDHVLDIGFGWGGFARYAAETYGCTVTGVNISDEQVQYATQYCKNLPIQLLHCDYRDIEGTYDKIVSVGMFEHVGRKNYRAFMDTAHRCLKEDGIFLLHTIGGNKPVVRTEPWITKYIFPNGMLPSVSQIGRAIEGLFSMEDWHNLGPHYDKTLMAWYANFQKAWPGLKESYSDRFRRMWEYYLLSCAGAFRARHNQLWQIVLTKVGTTQPACRL